jgi:hypothetical protein
MTTLNIWSFAFRMYQRKLPRDNEWEGLLRAMKAAFRDGTIGDYWKTLEPEKWFDPEFQKFIDTEILDKTWQNQKGSRGVPSYRQIKLRD